MTPQEKQLAIRIAIERTIREGIDDGMVLGFMQRLYADGLVIVQHDGDGQVVDITDAARPE